MASKAPDRTGQAVKYKGGIERGFERKKLKVWGYAWEPPIPTNQFGGNIYALRQFKAQHKVGKKHALFMKGELYKDLETGRLYMWN